MLNGTSDINKGGRATLSHPLAEEVMLQPLKEVKAMNVEARRVPAIEVTGLFDWLVEALVIVTLLLSGGVVCGTLG